jgi:hypothetical protein
MLLPLRTGWGLGDPSEKKEEDEQTASESRAHQAKESSRQSSAPAGTTGVAGCPEHKAPEQGCGGWGVGRSSDRPDRSAVSGSISEGSRPGSEREVTRWVQPAQAEPGAQMPWNTRSTTAPVPILASRLK